MRPKKVSFSHKKTLANPSLPLQAPQLRIEFKYHNTSETWLPEKPSEQAKMLLPLSYVPK